MAPTNDKKIAKAKPDLRESKSKLFSLRWFLRKSKSSCSSKEMVQSEKVMNVPSSKSCDAGLTALEAIDRYPKYLFWKLMPPPARSPNPMSEAHPSALPFRSSFSCNDVHSLCPPLNSRWESTQAIHSSGNAGAVKHPYQSLYNLSPNGLSHIEKASDQVSYQNVLCKLCLAMIPASSMYTLQDCSCVFCITCLHQYININIREGNVPVTCPDADCSVSGKVLVSEIREIAGENALSMFERYKLNFDVELDPSRVWCPAPGCETICNFKPSTNSDVGVPVYCFSCRLKFCSICKVRWHGKENCEEAKKSSFNEDTDSDDESWIKRCPNCRIPIEKDEGCAQMMCYRCKHVFCWHCLASLDDDFLLRHYDKGPCMNKLGHSRASMIWHRTQVIGIFAGFSFLLIMASPFLLLAAPCLLCCRCKNKFLYEEATEL